MLANKNRRAMFGRSLSILFTILFFATTTANAQLSPAPDFVPDDRFQASQLDQWTSIGSATWTADGARLLGNDGQGALLFDQSYQDLAFFTRFRCDTPCDAGILIRIEESMGNMHGILIAIEGSTLRSYRVVLEQDGSLSSKVSAYDPELDFSPQIWARPVQVESGKWNTAEIFVRRNEIQNHLNNQRHYVQGGLAQSLAPVDPENPFDLPLDGFGKVGVYLGSGSIAFDDLVAQDLNLLKVEAEAVSPRFRKQRISPFAYAWGADAADLNNDGHMDVISGPYYYLGPDYLDRREYYPAHTFSPGEEYMLNMLTFSEDWTGDGWPDILITEMRPLTMHVNPKGENRRWDRVEVLPDVCSEIVVRGNVDSDPEKEFVYAGRDGKMAYGEPNPNDPHGAWSVTTVSDKMFQGCSLHGVGIGDLNGDGRNDILQAIGWWEQPVEKEGTWIYHEENFGSESKGYGGGMISIHDFNEDGMNDVVASTRGHGWGMSWYEQVRSDSQISFIKHNIMGDLSIKNPGDVAFSELHSGVVLADIDRDGRMDLVSGKRHWAHMDTISDADPDGEAVLYWYRTVVNSDGGVEFEPELIHNKSGVGSELKVIDINQDGLVDILVAGTHGTFVFWGK